jgi:hypothetical protein
VAELAKGGKEAAKISVFYETEWVKVEEKKRDLSCKGVVLLVGYFMRQVQSERRTCWKLLDEKVFEDARE